MFSAMINHSYVPKNLLLSSIIPIPKDRRKSLNNIINCRSIVMCSALGKLFDNIVVHEFKDIFKTCDLQYGFKKGHSTNQCSFIVNEVVQYYRNNDSNIYLTLLDASNAFDKVNYNKLFQLLIQKGMCPLYCKFLATLYTSQLLNGKINSLMCLKYTMVSNKGVYSLLCYLGFISISYINQLLLYSYVTNYFRLFWDLY